MDSLAKNSKELSVLVPAFNEERNIQKTIVALMGVLDEASIDYEIVVVDDGSEDKTAGFARVHQSEKVKLVNYQTNMGKGYATKVAFENSRGLKVAFFDAGLDFHPEQILKFWQMMKQQKADVVIGSKRHPESVVDYPLKRRMISGMAQVITRILFNLNVRDTQVGLKFFDRRVLENVFPRALIRRYAYDIELLAMAQRYGYKIIEAPVVMKFNFSNSSVNWKAIWRSGWDTLSVFYRLKILRYYDKPASQREKMLAKYNR